ncbi:hypothetical protein KJ762_02330 [bacterium]|nr:hypothetical protein [bacterium]MBU1064269.1 hypothetical protein [bacterium]MBU1633329.1 hypothetical protein [bacterium]MBU1873209.1 hypothetical protein [bacterium]
MKTKLYRVVKSYQSPYPDSIFFKNGEQVTIGKEFHDDPDWKDWVWCESDHGGKAWTPKQFLEITENRGILNRDYNARELVIEPGEIITVSEIMNGFGMSEKSDGCRGWVPLNHLETLKPKHKR